MHKCVRGEGGADMAVKDEYQDELQRDDACRFFLRNNIQAPAIICTSTGIWKYYEIIKFP